MNHVDQLVREESALNALRVPERLRGMARAVAGVLRGESLAKVPASPAKPAKKTAKKTAKKGAKPLKGKTFLFTGKLGSGFTRDQAATLVRREGGKVVGHVSKELNYLVVGDAGSPNYKKDSKLARVERLRAEGHKIKVLSEKAFLKLFGIKYGTF